MLKEEPDRWIEVLIVALLNVRKEGQIGDAGGGEKVLQRAEDDASPVEVATLDLLERRDDGQRHSVVFYFQSE